MDIQVRQSLSASEDEKKCLLTASIMSTLDGARACTHRLPRLTAGRIEYVEIDAMMACTLHRLLMVFDVA